MRTLRTLRAALTVLGRHTAVASTLLLAASFPALPSCQGGQDTPVPPPSKTSATTTDATHPTPESTASAPVVLYAWANPMMIGGVSTPVDHTWVTTYGAPSACAPPAGYWYSWGSCHETGPDTSARLLDQRQGSLNLANCICQPDIEDYRFEKGYPPHGGIDFYAIHGVCHQLSNRILYATAVPGTPPATVRGARGYNVSRFVYGTYGTDAAEWAQRIKNCSGNKTPQGGTPEIPISMTPESDLEEMLSEHSRLEGLQSKRDGVRELHGNLLRAKRVLDDQLLNGEIEPRAFAIGVNELVTGHLRRIHELLGSEAYETFFEFPPGEAVGLVDPDVAALSNYKGRR